MESMAVRTTEALARSRSRSASFITGGKEARMPSPPTRWGSETVTPVTPRTSAVFAQTVRIARWSSRVTSTIRAKAQADAVERRTSRRQSSLQVYTLSSRRTVKTGQMARRRTRSATLPLAKRSSPERPWVPMAIRSAASDSASCRITTGG